MGLGRGGFPVGWEHSPWGQGLDKITNDFNGLIGYFSLHPSRVMHSACRAAKCSISRGVIFAKLPKF